MSLLKSTTLLGFVFLSACGEGVGLYGPTPVVVSSQLPLYGGAVVAKAPDGYCYDGAASRPAGGFAMMAACKVLGADVPSPASLAVITTQVGPEGSALVEASKPAFVGFLSTTAGEAVLSSTADAGTVTIEAIDQTESGVVARFVDTGPFAVPNMQQTQWRGFIDFDGRLVTLAVRGYAAAPLDADQGRALLDRALRAFIAANAPQSADDDTAT